VEAIRTNAREEHLRRRIEQLAACMTRLAAVMAVELSEARIDGYVRALSDLSEDQITFAFQRALATLKFFPQVAELRQFAQDYLRTPKAIEARERRSRELDERIAAPYKRRLLEQRHRLADSEGAA
jgi:hypothetical protein